MIAAAGGLLAVFGPPGRARACEDARTLLTGVALAVIAPSDVGPAVSPAAGRPVIGWSWLIPPVVDAPAPRGAGRRSPPGAGRGLVGWPVGYRYEWERLSLGAGFGADGARTNLSPEVGFMLLRPRTTCFLDPSLHVLAHAEIDPGSGHLRGATFLLGWHLT